MTLTNIKAGAKTYRPEFSAEIKQTPKRNNVLSKVVENAGEVIVVTVMLLLLIASIAFNNKDNAHIRFIPIPVIYR